MSAIAVAIAGLVIFFIGYRFYARYLADKVYRLDPEARVPSHTMKDGIDYVPTNKYVLFGHHFATIAGAAPIVGPALGVIWGWLPAFLWVVIGTVVMGGVHDLSTMVLSVRNRARSIGEISRDLIGPRAMTAYMIIIFFVLILVLAVFLLIIAGLLVQYPEAVFPVFSLMIIALCIGILIYRTNIGLGPASAVGIVLMALAIWWGAGHPLPMPEQTVVGSAKSTWILILAVYSLVASVLPVWLLLQPRDYLESFKLYAGLVLLFAGIIVSNPTIVAPAVRLDVPGAPPMWPFLFITIACGALSGFHSIVSSGTSPKQLNNERDAAFVGYGAMVGEGALALGAIIACTAGFASTEGWMQHYAGWSSAAGLGAKLTAFVDGAALFISSLGIPVAIGKTFIALIIIAFAMTTLDSACRLGRYIITEYGDQHNTAVFKNRYVAAGIMAGIAYLLAIGTYGGKPAGLLLWPLFGTTNQLLAALVFATITIYLLKRRQPTWITGIPLVLVAVTTVYAMLWNIRSYVRDGNWLLTCIGGLILLSSFLLIYLAGDSYMREKRSLQ